MKTNARYAKILLVTASLSAAVIPIQADTINWTNTSGGLWSDALNWEPNQVPVSPDVVRITSNGNYVVTLDVAATVNRLILGTSSGQVTLTNSGHNLTLNNASTVGTNGILSMSGGALAGSGLLTLRGEFNWSGGAVSGALTVVSNGVLNLSGGAEKQLYGVLTNAGTVVWTGASDLRLCNSAIHNLPGGLFDIQNDQYLMADCGPSFFDNAGTVRKSAGSGQTYFFPNLSLNNTGTVEAQTGTIILQGGGSLTGTFTAAAGAAINLTSGNFTEVGMAVFSGGGQSRFTGGTLTLTADVIPGLTLAGGTLYVSATFQGGSITNLTLAGVTLASTNTVTGTLNWTAGAVSGALTVASNGVLNLSGGAEKQLYGVLTNAGTVVWTGASDLRLCNSAIHNLPGGLFDIQNDQYLMADCGPSFFDNAGTVRKSAGSGQTYFFPNLSLNNTGTVEAQTGTIILQGGYSNSLSAIFAISLGGAAPGSGYGRIQFSSPPTFNGAFTVTTTNGYRPSPGNTFTVLNYPSAANTFACMSGLDLGAGLRLQPQFTASGLTLVAIAYATNTMPELFISPSPGVVALTWPLGFPDWTLQSCTDLASPFWSPVAQACGNSALLPTTPPKQFFRLKNNNYTNGNSYTNWNTLTNWTQTSAPTNDWTSVACSADGTKLVAVGYSGGIYTSTNSGVNWTTQTNASVVANSYSVASSAEGTKLAAAGNGAIFISTNAGTTWTPTTAPNTAWFGIASSTDGTKLAANASGSGNGIGGIYTSSNSGLTWTQTSAPGGWPVWWSSIASSADGTKLVATANGWNNYAGIYTSTDSGVTWTQRSAPNASWANVASSADGTKLAAAAFEFSGIYTSTDSGATWSQTSAPNNYWHSIASSADGTKLAAVGDNGGGIYLSADCGATWTQTSAPSRNWHSIVSSTDGTRLAAVDSSGGIWTAQATIGH